MGKALQAALEQIKKEHGAESIRKMSDDYFTRVDVISTGVVSVDLALGVGGIPRGRVSECFGPTGGGKTSLALHITAEAQRAGLTVGYIDMENALDTEYAKRIGVNVDDLFVSQPDHGQMALNITETLVRSGEVGLVVVDSVDALIPKEILEGQIGDHHPGALARLMSQSMRMLSGVVKKSNTALLMINQIRHTLMQSYGPTEVTSGGEAVKYYSSVRMKIRDAGKLKDDEDAIIGQKVKIEVIKNKVARPFKNTEVPLIYGSGFSKEADLLATAVSVNLIRQSGSWYSYAGNNIAQGSVSATKWLVDNPEVAATIRSRLLLKEG